MTLTELERQILRLHAEGLSDYSIAKNLKMETPNVSQSRKNALEKLNHAKADLKFFEALKSQYSL